jgi:predicted amidophosphoribosyltransferase
LPPLVIFWRCHRQLKRLRRGLCPRCLYDLRASPDRCPECGFVVDSAQPAPAPPQPSP